MTTIYFIRHCKVNYTEDDRTRPLSEQGREDAKKITEVFRDIKIDRVLSSPYVRAKDTVSGIAESKGLTIESYDDLRERKVSNHFIDDFGSFIENQWNDFNYKLVGGESLGETQQRGIKVLGEVLDKLEGLSVVIGTHGTILSAIMNHFDDKYDFEFWKTIQMPDVFKFEFNGNELRCIENLKFVSDC